MDMLASRMKEMIIIRQVYDDSMIHSYETRGGEAPYESSMGQTKSFLFLFLSKRTDTSPSHDALLVGLSLCCPLMTTFPTPSGSLYCTEMFECGDSSHSH